MSTQPNNNDASQIEELPAPALEISENEAEAVQGGMQLRAKRSEATFTGGSTTLSGGSSDDD